MKSEEWKEKEDQDEEGRKKRRGRRNERWVEKRSKEVEMVKREKHKIKRKVEGREYVNFPQKARFSRVIDGKPLRSFRFLSEMDEHCERLTIWTDSGGK